VIIDQMDGIMRANVPLRNMMLIAPNLILYAAVGGANRTLPVPRTLSSALQNQCNFYLLFPRFHTTPPNTRCKPAAMDNTFDKTAVETIDLLEARLRRIEYAICGHVDSAAISSSEASAFERLSDLEHTLHQLASKSRVIQDLLQLRGYHSINHLKYYR
jgi:hypothetical protein